MTWAQVICILAPIMVTVRESLLRRAMSRADVTTAGLADRMNCSHRTIENILTGKPVAHATQLSLRKALGDHYPGAKLFEITLDEDAEV